MAHWLVTTDADVMQAFLFRVVLASFVKFSFFCTEPRDLLGRTSLK